MRDLTQALPKRTRPLRAIEARLFDFHKVVREGYYHPEFRGSFSIKSVLPVMTPGMGYDDLEIADGQTAAVRYASALACADPEYRRHVFGGLRSYCEHDTMALVQLRRALNNIDYSIEI